MKLGSKRSPRSGSKERDRGKKAKTDGAADNLHVSSAIERTQVLQMITASKGVGAVCGSEVIAGFNSTMRALERGGVAAVCLTRDSPYSKPLVEASIAKGVALVILPAFTDEMGKVLGIKRASCIAILDSQRTSEAFQSRLQSQQMSQQEQGFLLGHIDALREYLLCLGSANSKMM